MSMDTIHLFLLTSVLILTGCEPDRYSNLDGLPEDTFTKEESYQGSIDTVGQLTEAYVRDNAALERANNKLETICIAAERCEKKGSPQ